MTRPVTRPPLFGLAGVRRLFRLPHASSAQVTADVDAEIAFHLDARVAALEAEGLAPNEARAQARREFGDVDAARRALRTDDLRHEQHRRRRDGLRDLAQDLRVGARGLRRTPGFTAVAVATLAVGIGASTAIFGAVDGVLLKPLPYADADRVVTLWQHGRESTEQSELPPGTFVDVRERARSFAALAAADPYSLDVETPDGPETIRTWLVTDGFFEALGVRARLGRTFRADEHVNGRSNVVVIGDGTWRGRFGADPRVVGRTITLDGAPYTVVGVMPPAFHFPAGRDVWAPKVIEPRERERRAAGYWLVVGRLAPGVTLGQARAELAAIGTRLGAEYPRTNASVELAAVPLTEQLLGSARSGLVVLLGASALLLLIACANVANLMLARALGRGREIAVRAALGAGRGRIVRLLAAEGAVLAALGGAAGVAVAWAGVRAIRALSPADLPRVDEIALDARVVAFAVLVSALTAAFFGLAPALRTVRAGLHDRLKAGGRSTTAGPGRHRTRAGLVVGEVALSLVLLVGAGLLVRSVVSLLRADRGFRADRVLAVTVQAWQWYQTGPQRAQFVDEAVSRLAALPGVRAAAVTSSLPLAEGIGQDEASFAVEGREVPNDAEAPMAHVTVATPGYFATLGMALQRGRAFTRADDAGSPPVVVVTEAFVRRHFPGVDPLGRRIVIGLGRVSPAAPREIVGVVADVRQTELAADPGPGVFMPHAQAPTGALTFAVRAAGDPAPLVQRVKRELWAINRAMPISDATTMDALLDDQVRERRFHLALLATFAVVALVLSAVGLFGVLSHTVRERRQEFGVRVALGASRENVLALVLREGGALVGAGALVGVALAAAAAGLLRATLYQVSPLDATTFASAVLLVLGAATVATFVPARRAARANPLLAMRDE